ncbi:hypothetical protein JW872_02560 [Candidatus Babeliales bacterium]|nr:hypothetical protein [Candidatus Babeliales bacterium]
MTDNPSPVTVPRFKAATTTYSIHDRVVYPGHGVAEITNILEKSIGQCSIKFYELKFLNKDMTVLVPLHNLPSVGIRPLSSSERVHMVFEALARPARKISPYELTASNWNKRNKEYQTKIRKGDLNDLSEIYRDLKNIAQQKELSFGEKNLLHQTEHLLVEEIALIERVNEERAIELLRSMISQGFANKQAQHVSE